VTAEQRSAWEQAGYAGNGRTPIRESGSVGALVPATDRPEYFPVAFCEPGALEGELLGYDIASDPSIRSALDGARRSGRVRSSLQLKPIRRSHVRNEFVLVAPIFADRDPDPASVLLPRQLSGFVFANMRLSEVLYPVLDGFKAVGLQVELWDNSTPLQERRIFLYSDGTLEGVANQSALLFKRQFVFAGQSWSVYCVPLPGFFMHNVLLVPGLVLLGGCIISGLLAVLLGDLFRQGRRVERLVEERTIQLERSNRFLRREIEARTKVEEKLSLSLAEKEVLLREVQHRVRNNLQFIGSLIHLQTGHLTDAEGIRMAGVVSNQVRSMAMVYERLQSDALTTIDFGEYVRNLAEEMVRANQRGDREIHLRFQLEKTLLNLDTAVPGGLIVNELLNNTFRHAFRGPPGPDREPNTIAISLQATEAEGHVLTVQDNGLGLPAQVNLNSAAITGMQVVALLVEQLEGQLTLEQHPGTRCVVTFREIHYRERI
jgi:two-component sensor histidine kinase